MGNRSKYKKNAPSGWTKRQKIISSVSQLVLVVLILPGILYLLSFVFPQEALQAMWSSLTELAGETPVSGNLLDFVVNFYRMMHSDFMGFFSRFIGLVGKEVMDVMMVGMCVYALSTLSRQFIPGIPALAVVFGSFIGVLLNWLTKASSLQAKLFIVVGLVIMNIVIIVILHGVNKAELAIKLCLMGFQAVIAEYSLFFAACLAYLITNKPGDMQSIWLFWIFPAIVFSLMLGLDFYVQSATEFRFVKWKG